MLYTADIRCSRSLYHLRVCCAEWTMSTAQLRMAGKSIRGSMATSRLAMARKVPTVPLTLGSPRRVSLVVSKIQQVQCHTFVKIAALYATFRYAGTSAAYAAPDIVCLICVCNLCVPAQLSYHILCFWLTSFQCKTVTTKRLPLLCSIHDKADTVDFCHA